MAVRVPGSHSGAGACAHSSRSGLHSGVLASTPALSPPRGPPGTLVSTSVLHQALSLLGPSCPLSPLAPSLWPGAGPRRPFWGFLLPAPPCASLARLLDPHGRPPPVQAALTELQGLGRCALGSSHRSRGRKSKTRCHQGKVWAYPAAPAPCCGLSSVQMQEDAPWPLLAMHPPVVGSTPPVPTRPHLQHLRLGLGVPHVNSGSRPQTCPTS